MTTIPNHYPNLTQDQLDAIAQIMDDDLREHIHSHVDDCTPGEFLTVYVTTTQDDTFADALKQFDTGAN